ncbi:unnamed protein product [Aureobasidium pullulans]|nr:unnamed protein product [Aureobasidium pullulans]
MTHQRESPPLRNRQLPKQPQCQPPQGTPSQEAPRK